MTLRYNASTQVAYDQRQMFADSFRDNPLVAGAAGATLIAAGCTSMTGAVILSLFMLVNLPLVGVIACREQERIDPRRRPAFYAAVTCSAVFLLSILIDSLFRGSVSGIGIYAPLAAMNGLVMHRTWPDARILLVREAVVEGLACAVCFGALALPVAFIRELLGAGSLFGIPLGLNGIGELQNPFFGFILCGFFIALLRVFTGSGVGKA